MLMIRTLRWLALGLALAGNPATAAAQTPGELLEPGKAFRISARALDRRSVEIEFKIARGYYLYRNRFGFATESGEPLAEVEIPRGKLKEDAFFGKSETFRDLVRIRVAISPKDAARGGVKLKVTSQGCADVGVCYTPLEQMVEVSLPGRGMR
jgi:thiol:disulfide interchange protein DsbD